VLIDASRAVNRMAKLCPPSLGDSSGKRVGSGLQVDSFAQKLYAFCVESYALVFT